MATKSVLDLLIADGKILALNLNIILENQFCPISYYITDVIGQELRDTLYLRSPNTGLKDEPGQMEVVEWPNYSPNTR